jgi:hypothetical protein
VTPARQPTAPYLHTQAAGAIMFAALGLGLVGAVVAVMVGAHAQHAAGLRGGPVALANWILLVGVGVLGIATLILFSSLTILVDDTTLAWWFGPGTPGLIRKSIALGDIATVSVVRNPLWYGWGIHHTPRGWLYNIAGRDAVEVTLRSGRQFRLGTDDTDTLAQTIVERTST